MIKSGLCGVRWIEDHGKRRRGSKIGRGDEPEQGLLRALDAGSWTVHNAIPWVCVKLSRGYVPEQGLQRALDAGSWTVHHAIPWGCVKLSRGDVPE